MNPFITYIIQTAVAISLFYLIYWLFMRKETFFSFNRYYFIISIFTALTLPLLDLGHAPVFEENSPVQVISGSYYYLENAVIPATTVSSYKTTMDYGFMDILAWVYIAVVIFLLFRLVFQALWFAWKIRKSKNIEIAGMHIVLDEKAGSPFSFFSWIFMNPEQAAEKNLQEILLHEKEHIRKKHSLDLILTELIVAFQWFNPFVWLFRRSVKETLEYLADRAVLQQGVPVVNYQKLLLSYAMGLGHPALITPLNFSLNKNRMIMMKKVKSPGIKKWKSLAFLPLVLLLGLAFSSPFTSREKYNKDGMAEVLHVSDSSEHGLPTASYYVFDGKEISRREFIKAIDSKTVRSIAVYKGEDAIKRYGTKAVNGAIIISTKVSKKDQLPNNSNSFKSKPEITYFVIDGKEVSKAEINSLDPDSIETVAVYTDEDATERYGQNAVNGAFVITTKTPDENKDIEPVKASNEIVKLQSSFKQLEIRPDAAVYVLNGKEISELEFKYLDQESIKAVEVWKGEKAVEKYGSKAEQGAIIITTKDQFENGTQNYSVTGRVINAESNEPLPDVNIVVKKTSRGTVSGEGGKFSLSLEKESEEVYFTYIGFMPFSREVKNGEEVEVRLQRRPVMFILPPATKISWEKIAEAKRANSKSVSNPEFVIVESMPEFRGGMQAFSNYIASQIKYPSKAKKNNVSGRVWVNFTIDKAGNVRNVYLDRGVDPDLDKEAIRIISGMPKWEPARQRGKAVPVELNINVDFVL